MYSDTMLYIPSPRDGGVRQAPPFSEQSMENVKLDVESNPSDYSDMLRRSFALRFGKRHYKGV